MSHFNERLPVPVKSAFQSNITAANLGLLWAKTARNKQIFADFRTLIIEFLSVWPTLIIAFPLHQVSSKSLHCIVVYFGVFYKSGQLTGLYFPCSLSWVKTIKMMYEFKRIKQFIKQQPTFWKLLTLATRQTGKGVLDCTYLKGTRNWNYRVGQKGNHLDFLHRAAMLTLQALY